MLPFDNAANGLVGTTFSSTSIADGTSLRRIATAIGAAAHPHVLVVAEHLQECGYALLCNGRVLMEHGGLLPVPRGEQVTARC